ncbi:MAG: hypothetical protein AAGD32_17560 [Planctomycetota bacterium]
MIVWMLLCAGVAILGWSVATLAAMATGQLNLIRTRDRRLAWLAIVAGLIDGLVLLIIAATLVLLSFNPTGVTP